MAITSNLLRYIIAGSWCYGFGAVQYLLLYESIPLSECHASICWIINYLIGTIWAHAIHRHITFKRVIRTIPYLQSLMRSYIGYGSTQVLGAIIIYGVSDLGGLHHFIAWMVTNFFISLINFVFYMKFII